MKRALALLLTGMFLTGAAFASSHGAAVTFYDGDPDAGAQALETAFVDGGTIGKRIDGIEDAEYVTLELNGQSHTYEIVSGGSSKNTILLNVEGVDLDDEDVDMGEVREDAPTLADVVERLITG